MGTHVALHVSAHPDDDLLGAPATLMALRDAGHRVVNLVVSLGRPPDHERRRAELEEASRRTAFETITADPPIPISQDDDLAGAEAEIRQLIDRSLDERTPALVVSPSPHDGHHGHEVVARAMRAALRDRPEPPVWWMWSVWGPLPLPTLFVPFDESREREIDHALEAYAGEIARNDYRKLIAGRGRANAVLGAELVFGFGEPGREAPYAELLTEVLRDGDDWWLGTRRELDPSRALDTAPAERASAWVDGPSVAQILNP